MTSQMPAGTNIHFLRYQWITSIAFALWLTPSAGQLVKYLGTSGAAAASATMLIALACGVDLFCRGSFDCSPIAIKRLFIGLWLGMLVAFLVLYPVAKSGLLGPGSDRDDALNVALRALLNGTYPYYAITYLGNPVSPMPGALLLALPFFLLGNAALQNLFWLPVFLWVIWTYFESGACAVFYVVVFLLACPASLQDYVTGGDYVINALYVGVAVDLVVRSTGQASSRWRRLAVYCFLALAVSSRPIYVVAVPVLGMLLMQRGGVRAVGEFLAIVGLAGLAINAPFALYDFAHFTPLTVAHKLAGLPPKIHAEVVLPVIALGVACLSFFVALDRRAVFGMIAAALLPMLVPLLVFQLAALGWDFDAAINAGYSVSVTVFAGIWLTGKLPHRRAPPAPVPLRRAAEV